MSAMPNIGRKTAWVSPMRSPMAICAPVWALSHWAAEEGLDVWGGGHAALMAWLDNIFDNSNLQG